MATGWVKSLQCKSSKIVEDVRNPIRKRLLPQIPSSACRFSVQTLKDVIETTTTTTTVKPKSKPAKTPKPRNPSSPKIQKSASMPYSGPTRIRRNSSARATRSTDPCLPALKELAEGHPSRNVVEIIFHTSWSPKAFPGRIEMVFKVQNATRTVARFEEYREVVKSRAGSGVSVGEEAASARGCDDTARCVADGNEVMQFHCLGPTSGALGYDVADAFPGGKVKGAAICTFSGSGAAHDRGGGGRGRRAMLVCRVVAGRVGRQVGHDSFAGGQVGFDSVSVDNGELLVFDSRAVLPCFLVIYKL